MTDAIEQYGRLSPWKPEALAGWKHRRPSRRANARQSAGNGIAPAKLDRGSNGIRRALSLRLANPSADTDGAHPMTDETKARRKLASRIQTETAKHGAVIVALTDEGKTIIAPGYELTVIGVYSAGVKAAWIAEDLNEHSQLTET